MGKFKFGDRVREIEPLCSEGHCGTLVDNGECGRYLVRWDSFPENLYGCRESNIELVKKEGDEE